MSDNNEIIPGGADYRGKVVSLLSEISGENDGNGEVIPGGAAFRAKVISLLTAINEKPIGDVGNTTFEINDQGHLIARYI